MKRITTLIFLLSIAVEFVSGQEIAIDVVYPRASEEGLLPVIAKVESTFVFGSVNPPVEPLYINGVLTEVKNNGAFLAFVPVDTVRMVFEISAGAGDNFITKIIPFEFAQPAEPVIIEGPFPLTLQVSDPHSVIRYSDNYGVYYLFPAPGAMCLADTARDRFYRIRLTGYRTVWVEDKYVMPLVGINPPVLNRIFSLELSESDTSVLIKIPCKNYPLHRIIEDNHPAKLKLILYKIESHLDVINNKTDYIEEIRWEQRDPETLELTIFLNGSFLWGYNTSIDSGGAFTLEIHKPPDEFRLKGLKICLDPGHGGEELGAIGPTRLLEKDVNLKTADSVRKLLEKKGAEVCMTRSSDSIVALYERMDSAYEWGADLFLSIHNNALPDGKNPAEYAGLSVHYYHPRSRELADFIRQRLLQKSGQADDGLVYDNLAVPRTTYMPAVLIECAYIIKPEEEMKLREEKFLKRIAKGIYLGLKDYLNYVEEREEEYEENKPNY